MVKRDIGQIGPMGFTRKGSFYYGVRLPRNDPYLATLDPVSGKVLAPPTRITERFQGSNTFADWSPDGEYLAYILRGDEYPAALGSRTLCIRSLESGEERDIPLKTLRFFGQARWSPDGRFILGTGGRLLGPGARPPKRPGGGTLRCGSAFVDTSYGDFARWSAVGICDR